MNNPHWKNLENLVLVAGHAVFTAENFDRPADDASWFLQDFQTGEPPFYIEHIRRGVELADKDRKALLVFSGGQTRLEAGPRSEAQSYWMVADHFSWWWRTNVRLRATTEEFATDSFQNLLFGICRFYECVRRFPQTITVVSWEFKRQRFDLHRDAIRFPQGRFIFDGVNNPVDLVGADIGEEANARGPFTKDPYGTSKEVTEWWEENRKKRIEGSPAVSGARIVELKTKHGLGKKRDDRNPFNRQHPYITSCPDLAELLHYQGPAPYSQPLPWAPAS